MDLNLSAISDTLKELNTVSLIFRIILAMILGGLIGLERGIKNRPAGFRTYILVCLGATMVMCTGKYIYDNFGGTDPARMGAQVVSGIGFLGAGTIIVRKDHTVKGLTTAAGLWAVACIGLAIGIGFYSGAIIGTIGIFITNTSLHSMDDKIFERIPVIDFYIEFTDSSYISTFLIFVTEEGFRIKTLSVIEGKTTEENTALTISLENLHEMSHKRIFQTLKKADGVVYLEEI